MNKTQVRSANTYYSANYNYTFVQSKDNHDGGKMHGSKRVVIFCFLTAILPTILIVIPLYLRNVKYADVMYKISDSDVIQIHKGQSSIFCEKHSLKMNSTFNAFQMKGTPELSPDKRKHIRLKKSMSVPDDTLEYWGFFLFKGATVELKACSRYEGSKILVVKGEKILNTCGILENNKYKKELLIDNQGQVLVTVEKPDGKKNIKPDLENNFDLNHDEDVNYINNLENTNIPLINDIEFRKRLKRNVKPIHNPNTILDAGVNHGGNAFNMSGGSTLDESVSSFENSLHECYNENILMNHFFPYSLQCSSTKYLENTTILKVVHEVLVDGYYYYIFYSDNDIVRNDIHVIFDIFKPTFQYKNISEPKVCINKTKCDFDVDFLSDELVIVEVPTKNGLNHEEDDSSILISVCHPRMSMYIFFPIAVLLLILLFAFL